jgi:Mg-chelatase subunit ChlI
MILTYENMKRILVTLMLILSVTALFAQKERWQVRSGNKAYGKGDYQKAELEYRRALDKDSTSLRAKYNLANAMYKNQNAEAAQQVAGKMLSDSTGIMPSEKDMSDIFHNMGNYSVAQKKWSEAVESYKNSLRINPGDMETKSNLAYAQKMLKNEQDKQNQQNQDNKDNKDNKEKDKKEDKKDNKDNNQDKKDQNKDPKQDQNQNQPPPKITPQAAQQMLQAIQNKENETQEKVKKEKAKLLESQQKEKNW